MMRIITGKAKGVRLDTLPGERVRPTTEMAKEGIFSAIQFELEGTEFLDLFSGSGQMGLEAVSRGAREATLVDSSEDSIRVIRKNAEKTKLSAQVKIVRSEYGEFIKSAGKRGKKYDYVFADAPYEKDLTAELCKRVIKSDLLRPGGLLMVETASSSPDWESLPEEVAAKIASTKQYRFSKCYVYFVRLKGEEI